MDSIPNYKQPQYTHRLIHTHTQVEGLDYWRYNKSYNRMFHKKKSYWCWHWWVLLNHSDNEWVTKISSQCALWLPIHALPWYFPWVYIYNFFFHMMTWILSPRHLWKASFGFEESLRQLFQMKNQKLHIQQRLGSMDPIWMWLQQLRQYLFAQPWTLRLLATDFTCVSDVYYSFPWVPMLICRSWKTRDPSKSHPRLLAQQPLYLLSCWVGAVHYKE